jgi:hypothetical protein
MWTSAKKDIIMRNVVEKGDAGRDVAGRWPVLSFEACLLTTKYG